MLKEYLALFLCLILGYTRTSAKSVANQESKGGTGVFEVRALYDHEANIVLYKDPTVPACFVQHIEDTTDRQSHGILLAGKPVTGSHGVEVSRFQKEFCSNLPLLQMEMNSTSTKERRRFHRTRRNAAGGYEQRLAQDSTMEGQRTNQNQLHWQGSQTQVEGNVAGNGRFSGQAQSTYGGLSQSHIQLGGVGLTGSMSSVAGGAQSALRLGTRSGAGQISSSGNGPSASELQLNLGEPGQESRAHAMVMQQHQPGVDGQGQPLLQLQQRLSQSGFGFSGYDSNQHQRVSSNNGQIRGRGSDGTSTQDSSLGYGREDRTRSQYDGSSASTMSGDFKSTTRNGQAVNGKNGGSYTARRAGQGRGYQHAIQAPLERINGHGQAQFYTDSVNVKDVPVTSSLSAIGQTSDQISTYHETEQQNYQESQAEIVKLRSQTNGYQSNGFKASSRAAAAEVQRPVDRSPTAEDRIRGNGFQPYPAPVHAANGNVVQRVEDSHQDSMIPQQPRNGAPRPLTPESQGQSQKREEEEDETLGASQTPEQKITEPTPPQYSYSNQPRNGNGYQLQNGYRNQHHLTGRGQVLDETDTSAMFQASPQHGNRAISDSGRTPYITPRQPGSTVQQVHESETQTSAVFQTTNPNGQQRRPAIGQTQYGGTPSSNGGATPNVQETDLSAVFQAPQANAQAQRPETPQIQNGNRPYTSQVTPSVQHQSGDSVMGMAQRPYVPQRTDDTPMMTTYPVTTGRRVYQRRIVTYYPGQMTPVNQHYVQQSMTGRQPQPYTANGLRQQQMNPGQVSPSCHVVTFQCTVIFDTNGKSKLCQPKPVNGNTQQGICCC